jgi:fatty acid desaturase
MTTAENQRLLSTARWLGAAAALNAVIVLCGVLAALACALSQWVAVAFLVAVVALCYCGWMTCYHYTEWLERDEEN